MSSGPTFATTCGRSMPSAARWSSAGSVLMTSSSIAVIAFLISPSRASRFDSSSSYTFRWSGGVMSVRLNDDRVLRFSEYGRMSRKNATSL